MAAMKFKYSTLSYQTDAVNSVVNVFKGQPYHDLFSYQRDTGTSHKGTNILDLLGYGNAPVELTEGQLLENIHAIQDQYNIHRSSHLTNPMGCCSLDVEMETGTGKTYVYIKTMYELNRQYGWNKFMVVVPSIAIREGVRKSFETMEDHFMEEYGKKARFFVYNSANLTDIDNYSTSTDLSVMIINVQAFNARGKDARRIRMELDAFQSRRPIDVIQANHPILILDEPQKMGGNKTQQSLKEFSPLFTLNYSATHKEHHDMVYVLDAVDAYRLQLVKKIEVTGFEIKNLQGNNGYLFLEEIKTDRHHPPKAKLEFEVRQQQKISRKTRVVAVDDDLYSLSNELEQYKGYHVSEINPVTNSLTFTNGVKIEKGMICSNGQEEELLRRIQIRETIRSHFAKEQELFHKGIKTLSLFFIDKVDHYRKYDDEGNELPSEYGTMFEEEYRRIREENRELFDSAYQDYLDSISVEKTHAGYFSIDKKGRSVDSKVKRGDESSDDESAYDLILKDKEKLLSLDNPVRFIFSHSALREGWDNPNVFQICTLKHGGDSSTNKRQEVGRGLRLCVNQDGTRMDERVLGDQVQQINKLTVIASDGYETFVRDLQKDISDTLYDRPSVITAKYFTGKKITVQGQPHTITEAEASKILIYLAKHDYISDDGHVTDTYKTDEANHVLKPVTPDLQGMEAGIHVLVQRIFDPEAMAAMIENGHATKTPANQLNGNFYKDEFQALWHAINHKYTYIVQFDSQELIANAALALDAKLKVSRLVYAVKTGKQKDQWTAEDMKQGNGFVKEKMDQPLTEVKIAQGSQVKYDLVGKIAAETHLTRRTVVAILQRIKPATFGQYQANPEEFIARSIQLINEQKATLIVDQITYNKTSGTYDNSIFTAEKYQDITRAFPAKKGIQDYVFTDRYAEKSVERKFAENLELDSKVVVYAKLPRGFQIPTPVGNYAPDWAIAFQKGTVKHVYFIAETKGSLSSLDLRPIEQAKIQCAHKLFSMLASEDVVYHEVTTYDDLIRVLS